MADSSGVADCYVVLRNLPIDVTESEVIQCLKIQQVQGKQNQHADLEKCQISENYVLWVIKFHTRAGNNSEVLLIRILKSILSTIMGLWFL